MRALILVAMLALSACAPENKDMGAESVPAPSNPVAAIEEPSQAMCQKIEAKAARIAVIVGSDIFIFDAGMAMKSDFTNNSFVPAPNGVLDLGYCKVGMSQGLVTGVVWPQPTPTPTPQPQPSCGFFRRCNQPPPQYPHYPQQ